MMITAFLVMTLAQTLPPPSQPPTTASVEVLQCAQAQAIVDQLLDAADARMELARQSNSAADMRAAVDALQATMRDVRAQLAPCANVKPPADPHLGHVTTPPTPPPSIPSPASPASPASPGAPKPPAAADPHAGHTMAPAPAKPAPAPAKPAAPAKAAPAKPQAEPAAQAVDPVCGLKVDPDTAPRATHNGRTYHFCSEQHRQLFQRNPAKYAPKME